MAVTAVAARVSRWVSTPMTPSMVSVRVVKSESPLQARRWVGAGRGRPPSGRTVASHAEGRTSCLSSQRVEPDRPAVQETSHRQGTSGDGQFVNESSLTAGQPDSDHQAAREVSQFDLSLLH
jgi:hypothetical protein